MPSGAPKTTKFSRAVTTIADIVALEQSPYDELIPARNLYQVFAATAQLHGERPALTVLPAGDPDESAVTLSHKGLLDAITRAANLFRSLGISPSSGAVAFLCPALPPIPAALIGAQVGRCRQLDQLSAQCRRHRRSSDRRKCDVLVIPSAADDAALWEKANAVIGRVPSLQRILVDRRQERFRSQDRELRGKPVGAARYPGLSSSRRTATPYARFSHRRHDRTPEACSPDPRQSNPCRLELCPGSRAR